MIRSVYLSFLALPAAFLTATPAAASPAACNAPVLPPLPTSVPTPEMQHIAPTPASCVNLVAYIERKRRPTAPAQVASSQPAATAPTGQSQQGAYVPKTQHDNTPWRFDMNQNGRRMTADEFDAWMKAKGIRVATGKPGASAPAAVAPAADASTCVASATVSC